MKHIISESKLNKIIYNSIKKVLNEAGDTNRGQYLMGRLHQRKLNNGDNEAADEIKNYAYEQGDNERDLAFRIGSHLSNNAESEYNEFRSWDMHDITNQFVEFLENDWRTRNAMKQCAAQKATENSQLSVHDYELDCLNRTLERFEDQCIGYSLSNQTRKHLESTFNDYLDEYVSEKLDNEDKNTLNETITESNKRTYRYRFTKTNTFKNELTKKCYREHGYDFDFEYHCVDKDGNIIDFPRGGKNFTFNCWYILKKLEPMKVGDYFEADVEI